MRVALAVFLLAAAAVAAPAGVSSARAEDLRRAVIFFPAQSAALSDLAQRVLDRQLALLDERALALTGEAMAEEGDDAAALSLARAEAVRDYLLARGVAPDQVSVSAKLNAAAPAVAAELRPRRLLMN